MRTNIDIDDKLMADALEATGAKTKKEAVELGLKALIRLKKQENEHGLPLLFSDKDFKPFVTELGLIEAR